MLVILSCNRPLASEGDPPFRVIEATSQEWISGARGGGRGINYRITIYITASTAISFDSMWVNHKRLKLTITKGDQPQSSANVASQDTLTLLASDYTGTVTIPGKRQEERPPSNIGAIQAPVSYNGAALLSYFIEDTEKYFDLPAFLVLSPVYGQ